VEPNEEAKTTAEVTATGKAKEATDAAREATGAANEAAAAVQDAKKRADEVAAAPALFNAAMNAAAAALDKAMAAKYRTDSAAAEATELAAKTPDPAATKDAGIAMTTAAEALDSASKAAGEATTIATAAARQQNGSKEMRNGIALAAVAAFFTFVVTQGIDCDKNTTAYENTVVAIGNEASGNALIFEETFNPSKYEHRPVFRDLSTKIVDDGVNNTIFVKHAKAPLIQALVRYSVLMKQLNAHRAGLEKVYFAEEQSVAKMRCYRDHLIARLNGERDTGLKMAQALKKLARNNPLDKIVDAGTEAGTDAGGAGTGVGGDFDKLVEGVAQEVNDIQPPPEGARSSNDCTVSPAEEERAINAVLDDWHDAASEGQEKRCLDHLADKFVFLGTGESESRPAPAFFAQAVPRYFKKDAPGHVVAAKGRNIALGNDGRTAWFVESLTCEKCGLMRGSGGLVKEVVKRVVGGVSKEEIAWRIAEYHLSLVIPDKSFDAVAKITAAQTQPAK
jgi:ketosteroid isomerase-like protein